MIRPVAALRFSAVLACLLILMGCEDKEKNKAAKEAAEAKTSLSKVRADLARARSEITDLNEQLHAVGEFRDELQQQVERLSKERDDAIAAAQTAHQTIKDLTAQLNRQAESLKSVQKEFKEVKAVIDDQQTTIAEQQAVIEELQKIIEEQATTEEQQENVERHEETVPPSVVEEP